MISEHKFAGSFISVWHEVAPLADAYWSVERLLVERRLAPMKNRVASHLRGLVNELAFIAFAKQVERSPYPLPTRGVLKAVVEESVPEAVSYVNRVSGREDVPTSLSISDVDEELVREGMQLTLRLLNTFDTSDGGPLTLRPRFQGCGVMSETEGDLVFGHCLFEIKAGDRNFRMIDLRQLLIYAALDYASERSSFEGVGLFNPRTGQWWTRSVEAVCRGVSGTAKADVLPELVRHFSLESTSR